MVVAVGLHPKHHPRDQREEDEWVRALKELSWLARVKALGEVGLDHSEPRGRWPGQMDRLERGLRLVRKRHALVLHCRGMSGDSGTDAYMLLLHIVRNEVSADQRVYLHCFSGDEYVLSQWSAAFPNFYLGFTRMVRSCTGAQTRALKAVEDDRIVLETDTPYFEGSEDSPLPHRHYNGAHLQITPKKASGADSISYRGNQFVTGSRAKSDPN
ncbi:putative deoxyribonuclease TATDN2 [Argopecten irradians]|uniref:putative deoxyribonuclease TATDN2 n=1 Tax=Argopecten irradians TaxID=31199 RepID=UPI00371F1EFD